MPFPTEASAPANKAAPPPKLRWPVRILSDLHLGHKASVVDDVAKLRPLLEGAGTVVFNGDTAEERAGRYRSRSLAMLDELRSHCAELGTTPLFITGNHDPQISEHHYLDIPSAGVFVTHGDCLFELVSPWSRKMPHCREAIQKVVAEYSDKDLDDLDKRMEMTKRAGFQMKMTPIEMDRSFSGLVRTFLGEMWPPRRPLAIAACWFLAPGRAAKLLRRYRPDSPIIAVGHTHVPGSWRRDGRRVVNTGGFLVFPHARALEVSEDGVFVRPVKKRGGQFVFGSRRRRI